MGETKEEGLALSLLSRWMARPAGDAPSTPTSSSSFSIAAIISFAQSGGGGSLLEQVERQIPAAPCSQEEKT